MIGLVLGSAALAQPAAVDVDEAQAMVDDLVEEVAGLVGRRFLAVPEVGIRTREGLREHLVALVEREEGVATPESLERVDASVQRTLALYTSSDERIHLVKEAFEEFQQHYGFTVRTLRPLLRCVLVHEMTHALQHQYGVHTRYELDDLGRGARALREGHAQAVAADYCRATYGDAMRALLDDLGGISLPWGLAADDEPALYAWGRPFARAAMDQELLWSALAGVPPSWSALVGAVERTRPPAWLDGDRLGGVLEQIEPGTRVYAPAPASPTTMLNAYFRGRWGRDSMPESSAGFVIKARSEARQMMVSAFLLHETGDARELVARRVRSIERAWEEGRDPVMYERVTGDVIGSLRPRPLDIEDSRVVTALRIQGRTTVGAYREVWVATPRRLLFFASTGRGVRWREIVDALLPVLDALSEETGASFALAGFEDWVDATRAHRPASEAHGSWQYVLQRARRQLDEGDSAACARLFVPLLEDPTVDAGPYLDAAADCARLAGDRTLARRVRAATGSAPP